MTGADLREAREALAMTQEALAEAVGFTGKYRGQQIAKYETGKRAIGAALEEKLRVALRPTVCCDCGAAPSVAPMCRCVACWSAYARRVNDATMPQGWRDILLSVEGGKAVIEIAGRLDISRERVYRLLAKARKALEVQG